MRNPGRAACCARCSTSYRWLASLMPSMASSLRGGLSLIRDAEVGEDGNLAADEAHADGVLVAAEFDGGAGADGLGLHVADANRQHGALTERPGYLPLRAADLGRHDLVVLRIVAVGHDGQPQ